MNPESSLKKKKKKKKKVDCGWGRLAEVRAELGNY